MMIYKGIHGLETLTCGCTVKHYIGGKTIFEASTRCTAFIKHMNRVYWKCNKCKKEFSKKNLKDHQWEHAI